MGVDGVETQVWRDGPPRRGAWRVLLGVEDDAALARALADVGRDRQAAGAGVFVGTSAPSGEVVVGGVGFPALPLIASSGAHVSVDVAGLKRLRPDVVMVDDLARFTIPDADHVPAVTALRALGIDVVSTLRAGDIRSLADRMPPARRSRSTVPDRALLEADEVEVVAGDSGEELVALAQEWADRPRVPVGAVGADDGHGWPGRIVVGLTSGDADAVVARAGALARATGARLVGAAVAYPDQPLADPLRGRRHETLQSLDADVVEVVDDSPGWALARVAEAEGAQVVVQGGNLDGDLVLDPRTAAARGLDLYIVAPPAAEAHLDDDRDAVGHAPQPGSALSPRRRLAGLVVALAGLPLLTIVLAAGRGQIELSTVLLLYLALTVATAAIGGMLPGLLAAVGSFALADFYFTRPFHRWVIADAAVVIALVVFVAVAVVISVLVDIAARRAADAARARAEATALGHLASAALDTRDPLPRLLHDLRRVFDLDGAAILRRSGTGWVVEHSAGDAVPQRPADATDALSLGSERYLVLAGDRTPAEDSRVLMAFAAQLAVLLRPPSSGSTS